MRLLRFLPAVAVSAAAASILSAPAAFASHSAFAKGGQPTCGVTITSPSSSSTTCTGTFSGENGVPFSINLAVDGVAVYQCQDPTGATAPGENQVPAQSGSTTSFTPSKQNPTFVTDPAVVTAPSTILASQAGCPAGSTPVNPRLTTIKVDLWMATVGDGTFFSNCVFDRNGLSGTIALSTC